MDNKQTLDELKATTKEARLSRAQALEESGSYTKRVIQTLKGNKKNTSFKESEEFINTNLLNIISKLSPGYNRGSISPTAGIGNDNMGKSNFGYNENMESSSNKFSQVVLKEVSGSTVSTAASLNAYGHIKGALAVGNVSFMSVRFYVQSFSFFFICLDKWESPSTSLSR